MPTYILHIPKTGGSNLRHTLGKAKGIIICDHPKTTLDPKPDDRFVFFVRSPLTRFVSAFITRLRCGRPRYNNAHQAAEKITFARYQSPEQLALDLGHADPLVHAKAIEAINSMMIMRQDFRFYLKSVDHLVANADKILFVGRNENMDEDYDQLIQKLGINAPPLSQDPVLRHKTPAEYEALTQLSPQARENVMRHYQEDYRLIKQLKAMGFLNSSYLEDEFKQLDKMA